MKILYNCDKTKPDSRSFAVIRELEYSNSIYKKLQTAIQICEHADYDLVIGDQCITNKFILKELYDNKMNIITESGNVYTLEMIKDLMRFASKPAKLKKGVERTWWDHKMLGHELINFYVYSLIYDDYINKRSLNQHKNLIGMTRQLPEISLSKIIQEFAPETPKNISLSKVF